MRVDAIRTTKARASNTIPALPPEDLSGLKAWQDQLHVLPRDEPKRRLGRVIGSTALRLERATSLQTLPVLSFRPDLVAFGDRFAEDASAARLLRHVGREARRVLVPGCFVGREDVQFWLRHGAGLVEGIDLYSFASIWEQMAPLLESHYGALVRLQQAPIEQLPFADGQFDVVSSHLVLEHVQNLQAMARETARETARVLRPGGWAWHRFGPLYFGAGGDHCIAQYGDEHAYGHILLPEDVYRAMIANQTFFETRGDPQAAFWARHDQFSFAQPAEYLRVFREHFEVRHIVAVLSEEGLAYRAAHPHNWQRLLGAGIPEEALLVKALQVVARKR